MIVFCEDNYLLYSGKRTDKRTTRIILPLSCGLEINPKSITLIENHPNQTPAFHYSMLQISTDSKPNKIR